jgi:hypothetical protein
MASVCELCGKNFGIPSKLKRHMARKTPCSPIIDPAPDTPDDRACQFCGRTFTSVASRSNHVRLRCAIAPNDRNGSTGMELLYQHTLRRQAAELDTLRAQQAELADKLRALELRPATTTTTTITTINVDNSHHLTVNVFGQEQVEHITPSHVEGILRESIACALPAAANEAVLRMALLVYSDPEHPNNITCYLPNKKSDDALVRVKNREGGPAWEVQPIALVLTPMARRSVDLLFEKQPFENCEIYEELLRRLANHGASGEGLRPVLVRNKSLLDQTLERLGATA